MKKIVKHSRRKGSLMRNTKNLEQELRACEQELLSFKCQHAAAINESKQLKQNLATSTEKIPQLEKNLKELSRKYENTVSDRDLLSQQLESLQRTSKKEIRELKKENDIFKRRNKP